MLLLYVALVLGALVISGVAVGLVRNRRDPVPPGATDLDVAKIARTGDTTRAIRWYRTIHSTGLRVSKEAVEQFARVEWSDENDNRRG
jgi:hypothetical protein